MDSFVGSFESSFAGSFESSFAGSSESSVTVPNQELLTVTAPPYRGLDKRCQLCMVYASFGFAHTRAIRCKKHKLPGMFSRVAQLCKHENCRTQATFGYLDRKEFRCAKHRASDMVRVCGPMCYIKGCLANPNYQAMTSTGKMKSCKDHADRLPPAKKRKLMFSVGTSTDDLLDMPKHGPSDALITFWACGPIEFCSL